MLFLALIVGLCFALVSPLEPSGAAVIPRTQRSPANDNSNVFVVGDLSDEDFIASTAAIGAAAPHAVVLLDTTTSSAGNRAFLKALGTDQLFPVGSFSAGLVDLERRLRVKTAPLAVPRDGQPVGLWKLLFPLAERVVVCHAKPRPLLLQAARLAGTLRAPLWIVKEQPGQATALGRQLAAWQTRTVYAVAAARAFCHEAGITRVVGLADERAVISAYLSHERKRGPIRNIVITNPSDNRQGFASMSRLAPWLATQRRAALLLTNLTGDNVDKLVDHALGDPALVGADALILMADLRAIPLEHRPNPIAGGKDVYIEMEPLTPMDTEPFSFATGRLFHEDCGVVALMLARQHLLGRTGAPRNALVVSNPTGGLPLLEAFSKNTAKELMNSGYETTALLGDDVNKKELRRLLPQQDIFLWEGHFATMVKDYRLHEWTESLRPALVFLQSCLALSESKSQPLLERGAICVLGSSTRTYSGTGGACSLAFFDALLYEGRTVGDALRQAKNFLLAYSLLKEKRLGEDARLTGANLRSAWAFSLWGDPTLKLPHPGVPEDALPHVRHQIHGNTIAISLPTEAYEKATTSKYKAQMLPNERLAGLITKEMDEGKQRLVPFVFVEVRLPKASPGARPRLQSKVPSSRWVFCWDARRSCGYLLITPRTKDRDEVRFHVVWEPDQSAKATSSLLRN
jgi:hypothetical protein